MPQLNDNDEFDYGEKPKNDKKQPKGCLDIIQPTPIIVALIALFGVIFAAVYQVPSTSGGIPQPLIVVIINALRGSDATNQYTPTPNHVETFVALTLTAVAHQTLTVTASTPLYTNTPFLTQTAQTTPPSPNTIQCLNYNQLATLGNILQRLESPPGVLSGLQIAFTQDWTAPNGWVIHRNSTQVQSVIAGDVASVLSPEVCRPLDNSAPTPALTPVVAQSVMSSCPGYPNMPYWASGVARSRAEMVVIPDGQIAFIDTWGLSIGQQNWSGGVFVIIRGPFSAEITITDGAFCGGIDSDANYEPLRQQRLSQLTNKNIIPTFIELP